MRTNDQKIQAYIKANQKFDLPTISASQFREIFTTIGEAYLTEPKYRTHAQKDITRFGVCAAVNEAMRFLYGGEFEEKYEGSNTPYSLEVNAMEDFGFESRQGELPVRTDITAALDAVFNNDAQNDFWFPVYPRDIIEQIERALYHDPNGLSLEQIAGIANRTREGIDDDPQVLKYKGVGYSYGLCDQPRGVTALLVASMGKKEFIATVNAVWDSQRKGRKRT